MFPLVASAASALVPPVADAISGASRKRRDAIERRNKALDAIIGQMGGEIGQNVTDSTLYKSGMGEMNQQFKDQNRANNQRMIASGATPEVQAGMKASLNSSFNLGQLRMLSQAQQWRNHLRQQMNALINERTQGDINDANETIAGQQAWAGGVSQMVPYLFDPETFKGGSTPTGSTEKQRLSKTLPATTWGG